MGIGATLIVAAFFAAPADVVEFERNADQWLTAVENAEVRAFDEFYPSRNACNVERQNEPAILQLVGGTMVVSAFDTDGELVCPISDEGGSGPASDGRLLGPGDVARMVIDIDLPITGFFAMYGSLGIDHRVTMRLFYREVLVDELVGPLSDDGVGAVGHGFISDTAIDRIVLTTTEPDRTMIGAFAYLAEGEPSLGRVFIPEYDDETELDFGVVFCGTLCGACCLPTGTCDVMTEIQCGEQGGLWQGEATDCADFNGNGIADVCERIGVCRSDSNGDGVVDLIDLITLLQDWGPCP